MFALYSGACINIQDIQRKKGAKCLISYFTLLGFLAGLKQTLSHACFTHFYSQLLASHMNPGGWIISPFVCPLSVYGFSLLYTIYLCSALPFSVAYTADCMPACSYSDSSFAPLLFATPQPACSIHLLPLLRRLSLSLFCYWPACYTSTTNYSFPILIYEGVVYVKCLQFASSMVLCK